MQQQQTLHNGRVKRQKFMWLADQLPHKKPSLGGRPAAAKPAAEAEERAAAVVSANPRISSKTHTASSVGGNDVQPDIGVRRSGRKRIQAVWQGYVSSNLIPSDSGSDSESNSDSDSDTGSESEAHTVSIGSAHQACLPQLQQRPVSGPTAAEAKFLSRPVYTPSSQPQQQQQSNPGLALAPGKFKAMWEAADSGPARLQLLQTWVDRMDTHVGQHTAQSLGLSLLGHKLKATWASHEELLFGLSMLERYRMFRHMKRCYLPKRSVHELNSYYHNVWKPRAGEVSEEYAQLCEQHGDYVQFRLSLCKRLAAIWDTSAMGPIPTSAALPPGTAAAALSAPTGCSAKAAAAATTKQSQAQPCTNVAEPAAATQPSNTATNAAASRVPATIQNIGHKVVALARRAPKRSKLAVAALQPMHARSTDRRATLRTVQLPTAGRRMALGLQQVRPVDAAAAGSPDTQRHSPVLCAASPAGATSEGKMSAVVTVQLPAVEGPQAMSHAAVGQQPPHCSWPSPCHVGQHEHSGGSAQHRLQQDKQQQKPALLPFPAGPMLQHHLPLPAKVHTQQLTQTKPSMSTLGQQQQQSELLLPGPAMQTPASGPAVGAEHLDSTLQPSCSGHSDSAGCQHGSAQSDGYGCPQPDCQTQNGGANLCSETPQPGCQTCIETPWPCISLLGSQSDVDSL